MSMIKRATFKVIAAQMGSIPAPADAFGLKTAHRWNPKYAAKAGYLYVRSRAISSRTNDNFDNFPAEEIKAAWQTFIGKPVFVNHHNANHQRARGVMIDAVLHEDVTALGLPDTWVEVLMEVDAVRFPKLAEAILKKRITRTSMGTSVGESVCSYCGNVAEDASQFCRHIPAMKGQRITRTNEDGTREAVLVYEICRKLAFFENSLLVEDPADPTAAILGVEEGGSMDRAAALLDKTLANAPRFEAGDGRLTPEMLRRAKAAMEGQPRAIWDDSGLHRTAAKSRGTYVLIVETTSGVIEESFEDWEEAVRVGKTKYAPEVNGSTLPNLSVDHEQRMGRAGYIYFKGLFSGPNTYGVIYYPDPDKTASKSGMRIRMSTVASKPSGLKFRMKVGSLAKKANVGGEYYQVFETNHGSQVANHAVWVAHDTDVHEAMEIDGTLCGLTQHSLPQYTDLNWHEDSADLGDVDCPACLAALNGRTAALPKTQTCKYCDSQATKRVLHAEGMAYIPVCDSHESKARKSVGESEVSGVKAIAAAAGALGVCRAYGCNCQGFEYSEDVGRYPTCTCGHSKNIHQEPTGATPKPRRRASRERIDAEGNLYAASLHTEAASIPEWAIVDQFQQYPQSGPEGISYFRGDIPVEDPPGVRWYVDCLLYFQGGTLAGVLNHYPMDMGPERKGNVNVLVLPEYRRQGIGTALWQEAVKRWGVTKEGQDLTDMGQAFMRTVGLLRGTAPTPDLAALALGEQRAPRQVDTLREESCPVCSNPAFMDGACTMCGYIRPPLVFHDPDTSKAKEEDLRPPEAEPVDLACDDCGAVYPAPEPGTKVAAGKPPWKDDKEDQDETESDPVDESGDEGEQAVPEDEDDDQAAGDGDDAGVPFEEGEEPQAPHTVPYPDSLDPADEEQLNPDDKTPERLPQSGDVCPNCGVGTLTPKDELDGVEPDPVTEDAPPSASPDVEAQTPEDTESEEDPDVEEDDGEPKEASRHMSTTPNRPRRTPPRRAPQPPPERRQASQGQHPSQGQPQRPRESLHATIARMQDEFRGALRAQASRHQAQMYQMQQRLSLVTQTLADVATGRDTERVASLKATVAADAANPGNADAAKAETTEDVESPGITDGANDDLAPDATTDVEADTVALEENGDVLGPMEDVTDLPSSEVPADGGRVPHHDPTTLPTNTDNSEMGVTWSDRSAATKAEAPASDDGRLMAAIRLARARVQAGIAPEGNDLVEGQRISRSESSLDDIRQETTTLERVVSARGASAKRNEERTAQVARRSVPRPANGQKAPSLASRSASAGEDPQADNYVPQDVMDSLDDSL